MVYDLTAIDMNREIQSGSIRAGLAVLVVVPCCVKNAQSRSHRDTRIRN
jgi:hypothetical protein